LPGPANEEQEEEHREQRVGGRDADLLKDAVARSALHDEARSEAHHEAAQAEIETKT
jgi:hypothetical protein